MIRAVMIVEMMGRPPEHLKESIEKHIGVLYKVRGLKVHSIEVGVPREVPLSEENKSRKGEELYSTFAEADFEVENMEHLTQIMFDFMPSSVEVIEPLNVNLDVAQATGLMNNICGRLHRYDELAKTAGFKLQEMNAQILSAKEIIEAKDREIEELKRSSKKSDKKTESKNKSSKKSKK